MPKTTYDWSGIVRQAHISLHPRRFGGRDVIPEIEEMETSTLKNWITYLRRFIPRIKDGSWRARGFFLNQAGIGDLVGFPGVKRRYPDLDDAVALIVYSENGMSMTNPSLRRRGKFKSLSDVTGNWKTEVVAPLSGILSTFEAALERRDA